MQWRSTQVHTYLTIYCRSHRIESLLLFYLIYNNVGGQIVCIGSPKGYRLATDEMFMLD